MQTTFPMNTAIFYFGLALLSSSHAADFNLGFEISPFEFQPLPGNCGIGGQMGAFCSLGNNIETPDPDTTPFYQGQVFIGGAIYWHIIVGDPNSGFAMESYTRDALGTGFGSFSGGIPTDNGAVRLENISGNGWDPLGIDTALGVDFTGNGSGDPTRTVIRQIMGDGIWNPQTRTWNCDSGAFCSEFLKDHLNFKPIIHQTINDVMAGTSMQAQFQLDMSNIAYSDNTTAGVITNTITFTGPDSEITVGGFDMATDAQNSIINGGRYVYNNCSNPSFLYGGSCWRRFSVAGGVNDYQEGSYTYSDGGTADPMEYDWGTFLDLTQNPFSGSGAGSGNKMKCENSSGAPNSC